MTDRSMQCAFEHPLENAHSHINQNARTSSSTLGRTLRLKILADKLLHRTTSRTLTVQCDVQAPEKITYLESADAHYPDAICDWMARIGEIDAATIAEVLRRCEIDPEARTYFLTRANESHHKFFYSRGE